MKLTEENGDLTYISINSTKTIYHEKKMRKPKKPYDMETKLYTSVLSQINPKTGYIVKQIQSSFEVKGSDDIPSKTLTEEFRFLWELTNKDTRDQYIFSLVIIPNTDCINVNEYIFNWNGNDIPKRLNFTWTDQILDLMRSLDLGLDLAEVLPGYVQISGDYKNYDRVLSALVDAKISYYKRDTYIMDNQFIITLSEEE